ncbi:hypothetical protein [Mesorhizobium sp. CAU 1741]|uniref:hypothetical protein n=1 Tax=Mesorhizobium sp. CAU 1741 TaxID=3140366 RepID=UPI00325C0577
MNTVPTLKQAVTRRMEQFSALGWTPSSRQQVVIAAGKARLILGWLGSEGKAMLPARPDEHVDTENLPAGVDVTVWEALPDTVDEIAIPTDDDVREAARLLGSNTIDKGIANDETIYWMRK